MSGILRLESLTKGNTLKQGDKTPLKYRLFDADGEKLNIAGKSAKVRLVYPDFLTIGYEKDGLTVAQDDTVTFTIDNVIPSRIYHVEIIVDEQFIFPSRADESKFTVDKSSLGTESNIVEIVGVDAVVRKAVDLINEDPNLIIDEDKLVNGIISNTGIGSIEEYYQQFNDVITDLSEEKDYHSLPEISGARGGFDTLGDRLNETTAQLAQTEKQKVDKGGNEQITMPMLAPDIKQAINDGVWNVNVNTSDIEDNAVDKFKADFYPQKDLILKNLYQYGNFESTTGVYSGNSNFEVSNNEVTFTATATNGYIQLLMSEPHNPAHKYYIRATVKSESESDTTRVTLLGKSGKYHSGSGNYETISISYDTLTSGSLRISDTRTSGFTPIKVKQVIGINLTETFGAGNEPTAEYMDTIMTQFENGWFGGETKAKDNALDIGKVWANVDGKMKMAKVSEVNDDRIIGKNILANNDFTQGVAFWAPHNSSISSVGGVLRATGTGSNSIIGSTQTLNVAPDGLYYLRARIRTLSDATDSLMIFDGTYTSAVVNNPQKNQWYEISGVQNLGLNRVYVAGFFPNATLSNGAIIEIEKTMVINLTKTFGAGNEPSANEMDVTLERVGWFSTEKELVNLRTLAKTKADKAEIKPLSGKKIVFAGDSVTEFGNYPEVAGEKTGAEVINIGIGGSCMVKHSSPSYDAFSMVNLADSIATGDWSLQIANKVTAPDDDNTSIVNRMTSINWSEVDILCIAHGTNDYNGSYTFGDEGEFGKASFVGGLPYIVETILTAHPHISIVFITPTWRKRDGVDADTVTNGEGKYLVDYIDAIIKNAEKNKLPVLDMYRTSGINKYTEKRYLESGGDVHPNATGYTHFGHKVGAFLGSHF